MILYFSGTGNSRHAAELIHSVTGGDIISINDIIKHSKPSVFESEEPYVIVCPTYAWRVPRVVEDFIIKAANVYILFLPAVTAPETPQIMQKNWPIRKNLYLKALSPLLCLKTI